MKRKKEKKEERKKERKKKKEGKKERDAVALQCRTRIKLYIKRWTKQNK